MNYINNYNDFLNSVNINRPRSPSVETIDNNDDQYGRYESDGAESDDTLQDNDFCANIQIDTGINNPIDLRRQHTSKDSLFFFSDMINYYTWQLKRENPTITIPSNPVQHNAYSPHPFQIFVNGRENPIYVGDGENNNDFTDDMMKIVLSQAILSLDQPTINLDDRNRRCINIILRKAKTNGGTRRKQKTRKNNMNNMNNMCKTRKHKKLNKKFPKRIKLYSNPRVAQKMAYKYLNKTAKLYPARNPAKKYSICDPKHHKWVNFGQMGYEDFTKHHNKKRRHNYLTRTKYMRGDWKQNHYSANNLSRNILW